MRKILRAPRFRQAVLAACLPYLLVSVFVDFVHVHAPAGPAVYAAVPGEATLTGPGEQSTPRPDYTCTACLWLKTGLQLVSSVPVRAVAQGGVGDLLLLPTAIWPDGPAVPAVLLRGPPQSLLV